MLRHYLQCLAMKIVGLVGHIGAGKTSIAKFLESTGYLRITLSDFLIQEARAREVAPTRVNLQHLGDELRRRNGGSVLFKRALEMANRVKADRGSTPRSTIGRPIVAKPPAAAVRLTARRSSHIGPNCGVESSLRHGGRSGGSSGLTGFGNATCPPMRPTTRRAKSTGSPAARILVDDVMI